jgi:glycosyltransferase involved in cell wall biosynthesis
MKIAIVGPSPVPYAYGGAEGFMWKLTESINDTGPHQAELIKQPSKESSFWDLVRSYQNFYNLDLSHFDMVISTKYPSWMVRHDNHHVYMIHHLRGLFDTYHLFDLPRRVPENLRVGLVDEILGVIESKDRSYGAVEKVFEKLMELEEVSGRYDKNTFNFPGPFIREIVHYFDSSALSPDKIKGYFSISDNVKLRTGYFPDGVPVKTLRPPSKMDAFYSRGYDYLFTASRLDEPKRIDLLVESMRYVPHDVKLKIAGTGSEENMLRDLIADDKRVELLGFVDDKKLLDLYSDALGVLYIPYDEDYGLITVEAMMSKKPVITAIDSGGPLEFVRDSETGFVVEPKPETIAEKINILVENPEMAKEMGYNARKEVEEITWDRVVAGLLGEAKAKNLLKKRIVVLSTYSCYPPQGGGQYRLFNIYSRLARQFEVTICSIVEINKVCQDLILENGLQQICVQQSIDHAESQWNVERDLGINLYDVCMIDFIEESTEYLNKAKELIRTSDIVVFSHPYLYRLSKYVSEDKLVIYEAHNAEYLLKTDYIKNNVWKDKVKYIEEKACRDADMIWVTSKEDGDSLVGLYDPDPEKIVVVPNGVDTSKIAYTNREDRMRHKIEIGLSRWPTVLFVGSWHPPNLEALRFIVTELAKKNKDIIFMVVGSVKDYYITKYGDFPKNVLGFGVLNEDEKYEIYKLSDIAINPMFSGSGTNIKMLDYMSAGLPIISTPVGSRGLSLKDEKHILIASPAVFMDKILYLLDNVQLHNSLGRNARNLAEDKFSWDKIVTNLEEELISRYTVIS